MKKLLSMAFCAAAMASFAADEISLGEVGVIRIDLKDNQKNTIIAASFTDLESDSDISIDKLVKTTNLEEGAQILFYTENNTYSAWRLNAEGGTWEKAKKVFKVNDKGVAVEAAEGAEASAISPSVGSGLWIIRGATPKPNATIALYGKFTENRATSVVKGKWNLVGNAGTAPYSFSDSQPSDRVYLVTEDGNLRTYTCKAAKGTSWVYYEYGTTPVEDKYGNVQNVGTATEIKVDKLTVAPGIGFWYYTAAEDLSLSWQDK